MKHSIDHLPKYTQEELSILVELIKRYVPNFEMIILFGSYARGGFVLWDEKMEFGIHTSYQSDLDIMVVASKAKTELLEYKLRKVEDKYHRVFDNRRHPYPSFIVENINDLNRNLEMTILLHRYRERGYHALRFGEVRVGKPTGIIV